jgi:hypothetical protein
MMRSRFAHTARGACRCAALGALVLASAIAASSSSEPLPDAETVLEDVGFSADEISQVMAERFVEASARASNERELDASLAFLVATPPTHLANQLRQGLLDRDDPDTIAFESIQGTPTLASFGRLALQPEREKRAKAYAEARPGEDLNLSSEEIAAFDALGAGAAPSAVEGALRHALLARLQAYQARGLAGIAPYARSGGKTRSAADDLRSAVRASKELEKLTPNAYQALLAYPSAKPAGLEETFEWSQFEAHGVPTIALTHWLFIPDGDAWVVAQRQFYVSGGYNCEQAVSGFLPMRQGTLVLYTNRTSTDQVTGFGGGAKRAIGSKLLVSELEKLYGRVRAADKAGGGS